VDVPHGRTTGDFRPDKQIVHSMSLHEAGSATKSREGTFSSTYLTFVLGERENAGTMSRTPPGPLSREPTAATAQRRRGGQETKAQVTQCA
jgi:hypothetical protein